MNVSLQSTSSSKEVCNHELVIKYKVRHLFLYPSAPVQEGKEKRENRTVMIPSLRADGWKWLPLIRWTILPPWRERRRVHSKRCVSYTHAHQGGEKWGSPHVVQRPRTSGLPEISTLDADSCPDPLRPSNSAPVGVRSRDLHSPQALFIVPLQMEV